MCTQHTVHNGVDRPKDVMKLEIIGGSDWPAVRSGLSTPLCPHHISHEHFLLSSEGNAQHLWPVMMERSEAGMCAVPTYKDTRRYINTSQMLKKNRTHCQRRAFCKI